MVRRPRAATYGFDTLKVHSQVSTLIGEPCGKHLASILDQTPAQLEGFGELDQVADRLTAPVYPAGPRTSPSVSAPTPESPPPSRKSPTGCLTRCSGWPPTAGAPPSRTQHPHLRPAQDPYQRLCHESGFLHPAAKDRLQALHEKTNPAELTRNINRIQQALIASAKDKTLALRDQASWANT